MSENILVTGGTGKTGRRVVERLKKRGYSTRIASRNPKSSSTVRFDWKDHSTFEAAFNDVRAIYLVAPTDDFDTIGAMKPALEAAIKAGVSRFVLLSASSLDENGPMMGAVHAWLRQNAQEWSVLRPSWFMQNFSEGQHLDPIRNEASLFSATEDGRVGFIDAEDIANCAATLLAAPSVDNTDHILTGPDAITYGDVAEALTKHLGRKIKHHRLTPEGVAARFRSMGLPEAYAETLAAMDTAIAGGSENQVTDSVHAITGKIPTSVENFIERNLKTWQAN
ncbi:MAG: ergot alkaloid biosynthesis protein [Roseibium sp.]|uniref:ergot alkaloid biosynthesis protein n=1 Tax=Roseibium sp. TaxID=1936156 RepID=UPI0026369627|nr:ergot alkaloid biosynthesis protein [Roseibium sp.]MCV0425398.1 ergot alkaloid biosynthesis protein [Roseibium sp.]